MTTYVFGAGASCHAGYPLGGRLGDALVAWIKNNPSPVNHLHGAPVLDLSERYGGLPNLEEILTELEECPSGSRAASMSDIDGNYAIAGMRTMIPEFFRALRNRPAPLYERLALERVRHGDSIITFNCDTTLERELRSVGRWAIRTGYGFDIEVTASCESDVVILKLHGSANWLEVVFKGALGLFQRSESAFGPRPVVLPGELQFLGYPSDARDPLGPGGNAGAYPAIIMPTLRKQFYEQTSSGPELASFWDDLWTKAKGVLSYSKNIVIVGYSMPSADERARDLLLGGPRRDANIEIYCGSDSARISQLYSSHGFSGAKIGKGSCFEDFLNETGHSAAEGN